MAVADPDLDRFRHDFAAIVGVPVSDVGMLPDADHLAGGGYHCGRKDLISIGKFHPPPASRVGSSSEDYSARQLRDRNALDDRAAAVDIPDGWGNGGNTAWIAFNNMVLAEMQRASPALAALRGMNFTPDGKVKRRYDTNSRAAGVIVSTDTVLWHTHLEFWRDMLGTAVLRQALNRLLALARAAVAGKPAPPEGEDDDDMGATQWDIPIPPWNPDGVKYQVKNINSGIVNGGAADKRLAWLGVCNDTLGEDYAIRVFTGTGNGGFSELELKGDAKGVQYLGGGLHIIKSGYRASAILPDNTVDVSIARQAIVDGKVVWPTAEHPPYQGDLNCSAERGAVQK
jgi:hypothetical protein